LVVLLATFYRSPLSPLLLPLLLPPLLLLLSLAR
jgi:hypothetical protein